MDNTWIYIYIILNQCAGGNLDTELIFPWVALLSQAKGLFSGKTESERLPTQRQWAQKWGGASTSGFYDIIDASLGPSFSFQTRSARSSFLELVFGGFFSGETGRKPSTFWQGGRALSGERQAHCLLLEGSPVVNEPCSSKSRVRSQPFSAFH